MIHSLLRSTLRVSIAAAATLLVVAGSAAPVVAAEAPRTAVIDVRGIDLTTAAGQARINAEIARAARRVCDSSDSRSLALALANRNCESDAIGSASLPQANFAGAAAPHTALADAAQPTKTVSR